MNLGHPGANKARSLVGDALYILWLGGMLALVAGLVYLAYKVSFVPALFIIFVVAQIFRRR